VYGQLHLQLYQSPTYLTVNLLRPSLSGRRRWGLEQSSSARHICIDTLHLLHLSQDTLVYFLLSVVLLFVPAKWLRLLDTLIVFNNLLTYLLIFLFLTRRSFRSLSGPHPLGHIRKPVRHTCISHSRIIQLTNYQNIIRQAVHGSSQGRHPPDSHDPTFPGSSLRTLENMAPQGKYRVNRSEGGAPQWGLGRSPSLGVWEWSLPASPEAEDKYQITLQILTFCKIFRILYDHALLAGCKPIDRNSPSFHAWSLKNRVNLKWYSS